MTALSVEGCQNVAIIDAFWAQTEPEERAALHTAFNLVRAIHSTNPHDLIECAKSARAYSTVRCDFSRWLDDNIREGMTAKEVMKLILQKDKWIPSDDVRH